MPERRHLGTVFLCGDVMTGRGVDQILPHPSDPALHEPFVQDARVYVDLAEVRSGKVPRKVDPAYIWGAALQELEYVETAAREPSTSATGTTRVDARVINLETSITRSDAFDRNKAIHYRMHPANVDCLTAAGMDVCVLANNHVLDWGRAGLVETLDTLSRARIRTAGAGRNRSEARRPAVLDMPGGGRLLVFAAGSETSGVAPGWAADETTPGVECLDEFRLSGADAFASRVSQIKQPGDLAIASLHWGSNWGYDVSPEFVRFAHRLIDGGIDLVHGHSSHHPRPIEVYRGHLILYGCGDFINDYEGITGYEEFRGDLALMYLATLDRASGELVRLRMVPMQLRRLRLERAAPEDARWLHATLAGICGELGPSIELACDGSLILERPATEPPGSDCRPR